MRTLFLSLIFICFFENFFSQNTDLKSFQDEVNFKFNNAVESSYKDDFKEKYDAFYTYFKNGIASNPETLNYPFKQGDIFILQSKDKLLKVYSWMIQSGYSGRTYNNLFQFKSGNKVLTSDNLGTNFICEAIYEIPIKNRKYYILVGSSNEGGVILEDAYCYEIVKNQLQSKEIFINKKEKASSKSVGYLFEQAYSGKNLLSYNPKRKTFYVPVIDKDRIFKRKFYLYTLKGEKLVYSGIK